MADTVFPLSLHAIHRYKQRLRRKGVSLKELDDDILGAKMIHGFLRDSNKFMLRGKIARYVLSSEGTVISVLPLMPNDKKS